MVSDSWSTDVVASDNEGLGESRQDAAQQLFAQNAPPALAAGLAVAFRGLVPQNALAPAVQLPADPNAPPDPPQLQQRLAVGGVQRHPSETRAFDAWHLTRRLPGNPSGAPEDRSDTWSLDATASDSEADAVANTANTEQDLLVLDDLPNIPQGHATLGNPGGASRRSTTAGGYSAANAVPAPMLRRKSSQPSAELESLPEAGCLHALTTSETNLIDIPGPSGISLPVVSNAFSNVNESPHAIASEGNPAAAVPSTRARMSTRSSRSENNRNPEDDISIFLGITRNR